jgi:hypothetical protein
MLTGAAVVIAVLVVVAVVALATSVLIHPGPRRRDR